MSTGTAPKPPRHYLLILTIIAIAIPATVIGFASFCPLYSGRANEEQSAVNGIEVKTVVDRIATSTGIYPYRWALQDSLAIDSTNTLTNPYNDLTVVVYDVSSVGRPAHPFLPTIPELEGHVGYFVSQDRHNATIFAFGRDGRIVETLVMPTLVRRH